MSKLYCAYCHTAFDEDELIRWSEPSEHNPGRMEEHQMCPNCKEENCIEDMHRCEICGAEILPEKQYCEDCDTTIRTGIDNILAELHKASGKPYTALQDKLIDWLDWNGYL